MFQNLSPIALGMPGGMEWVVIAVIGVLIFGKRLPEVGKSLGRSIVEFKKGLKGMEEEVNQAVARDSQAEMLPPPQSKPATGTTSNTQESAS